MSKGRKARQRAKSYTSKGKVPTVNQKIKNLGRLDRKETPKTLEQRENMISNVLSIRNPNAEQKRLQAKFKEDRACRLATNPYVNKYRNLGITFGEAKQAYLTDSLSKLDNKYRELSRKLKEKGKNDRRNIRRKAG